MTATARGIELTYDAKHDLLIARPRWTLSTRADVEAWFESWVSALAPYSTTRRPDVVVVLDDFHVRGEAVTVWGQFRARLNNDLFGISFRVNSDLPVRATIVTSGVTYNAATAEASTIEAAIEGILAARTHPQAPHRGSRTR